MIDKNPSFPVRRARLRELVASGRTIVALGAADALSARVMMLRLALFLLAWTLPALAQAGDLGINLYGLSYHFDRDKAREAGIDNRFNPGLGIRYRVPHGERLDWMFDADIYHDSGRNTAVAAGGGGFWHASERLRLGAALAVLHSRTYNQGKAFIAPLPIAGYEWRLVTLNMIYSPKLHEVNSVTTLGFWLTFWLR